MSLHMLQVVFLSNLHLEAPSCLVPVLIGLVLMRMHMLQRMIEKLNNMIRSQRSYKADLRI